MLVVAHVVEGAAGNGLGPAGEPCLHRPLDVGREPRGGQALVEVLFQDVADQVAAVGGVGHDGQLDRDLHTRVHLVEGDLARAERHGPGLLLRAVVEEHHEGRGVRVGPQAPGGGIGDRPGHVDLGLRLGIARDRQVCNLATAQAGPGGAVPVVVVEEVTTREAAGTDHGQRQQRQPGTPQPGKYRGRWRRGNGTAWVSARVSGSAAKIGEAASEGSMAKGE